MELSQRSVLQLASIGVGMSVTGCSTIVPSGDDSNAPSGITTPNEVDAQTNDSESITASPSAVRSQCLPGDIIGYIDVMKMNNSSCNDNTIYYQNSSLSQVDQLTSALNKASRSEKTELQISKKTMQGLKERLQDDYNISSDRFYIEYQSSNYRVTLVHQG